MKSEINHFRERNLKQKIYNKLINAMFLHAKQKKERKNVLRD